MATVEELYKHFGVLEDAKENAVQHEIEYLELLKAVHGDKNEKKLASQFLTRFFKYFPQHSEKAINAQFDLCEDEDVNIRKQAIKDIPTLCKDQPQHVQRIADVLTQLLQTQDPTELSMVNLSMNVLMKINAKASLTALFDHILQDDSLIREHAIKYLENKLHLLPPDILTKEIEEFVVIKSKEVLQDVTGEEFATFIKILSDLKCMSSQAGKEELLAIVISQAELQSEFHAEDWQSVERLMQCIRLALPMFSVTIRSTAFVAYICDRVLPVLSLVASPPPDSSEGKSDSSVVDNQLEMLKLTAELATHCGDLENVDKRLAAIYSRLLDFMPLPPTEDISSASSSDSTQPKLQFSHIECLMYTLHRLMPQSEEFLGKTGADDFRIRLQYLATGLQTYIKQLRSVLQNQQGDSLRTRESKIKIVALKTTSNINSLIKDFFHKTPVVRANITLSWKPFMPSSTRTSSVPSKRPLRRPSTDEVSDSTPASGSKKVKDEMKRYAPPSGKFSQKAGAYPDNADLDYVDYGSGESNVRGGFYGNYNRGWRGRGRNRWNQW